MERNITTKITTAYDDGKVIGERRERQPRTIMDVPNEMRVLCWALSLLPENSDFGFFRNGQCQKCSSCNDDFHFLHYTSEMTGYCVKCYLDKFCDVVDDENGFRVILKRSGRVLIEIRNS